MGKAEADGPGQLTSPGERPDMGCLALMLEEKGTAGAPKSSVMDDEHEKCISLFYCLHVDICSDQWPHLF